MRERDHATGIEPPVERGWLIYEVKNSSLTLFSISNGIPLADTKKSASNVANCRARLLLLIAATRDLSISVLPPVKSLKDISRQIMLHLNMSCGEETTVPANEISLSHPGSS